MNNGLLAQIYSFGNTTRNKLRGLLDDPVGTLQQAADAAASGLNNLTGKQEVEQQFALRDRIQAGDKNALAEYKRLGDKFNEKMLSLALDSNPAAVGMTAWHGSPHKFDKFDLAKIGTGEGAQAYGHGLYLAESPKVAQSYQVYRGTEKQMLENASRLKAMAQSVGGKQADEFLKAANELEASAKSTAPSLYKTDIPDEAVARFLDWDKPLSQQAPEVQAALAKSPVKYGVLQGNKPVGDAFYGPLSGGTIYKDMTRLIDDGPNISRGSTNLTGQDAMVSQHLAELGIPGIRYLDGGSRAAGQGSSNFVVFDPNMIRILERNGEATGAQPWKPGEWGGLLK